MIFSESSAFTKAVLIILREEDYFELQDKLIDTPGAGDVIPGSKGLRKIRVVSGGKTSQMRQIQYCLQSRGYYPRASD